MSDTRAHGVKGWIALAVALLALNAALTFHNVWPTLWVTLRAEVSVELGVLLLALVAWTAFVAPVGKKGLAALTLLAVVLLAGRYAEVTAPALYGRPVNLYWDAQHIPKVAAMLAEVGPWWLVLALFAGLAALLAGLVAGVAWCLVTVTRAIVQPAKRWVVGALAAALVGAYALGHAFEWRVRFGYALPVAATFWQQARFTIAAWTADPDRDLPAVPLPPTDLGRLAGDDVLLMFLESYGAVTYDDPQIARIVAPARDELAHAAQATGRHVVSAFPASAAFGGGAGAARASFMSGVEVRDSGD